MGYLAMIEKAMNSHNPLFLSMLESYWGGVTLNVSKFRKTNKRPSRICGGLFVYDLSGGLHSSGT